MFWRENVSQLCNAYIFGTVADRRKIATDFESPSGDLVGRLKTKQKKKKKGKEISRTCVARTSRTVADMKKPSTDLESPSTVCGGKLV